MYNCIQLPLICQETKQKSFRNLIAKRKNKKLFLNLALSGFLFYDIFKFLFKNALHLCNPAGGYIGWGLTPS